MKKLTFYLLCLMPFLTNAQYTLTDDDVVVTNGVIESCDYSFAIRDIIIPETLDSQTVTAIGNDQNNLFGNKGITSVQLPSTLQTIGSAAFFYNNLTNVTIPNTVSYIGNLAFSENTLTSLTIPNTVTYIGNHAFAYNRLIDVTFEANSNIVSIGVEAFFSNSGLTSISLPTNANKDFVEYTDGKGNIYNPGDKISDFLTTYYLDIPYTLTDDDVVVINGVIESCSYDFIYRNIIIPDILDGQTVTVIGNDYHNLFSNKYITSVQLPPSLQLIGENAFANNILTDIYIPNGVTSIDYNAFFQNNLTSVTIPSTVTYIGKEAFYNNRINSITFEPNIISILLGIVHFLKIT